MADTDAGGNEFAHVPEAWQRAAAELPRRNFPGADEPAGKSGRARLTKSEKRALVFGGIVLVVIVVAACFAAKFPGPAVGMVALGGLIVVAAAPVVIAAARRHPNAAPIAALDLISGALVAAAELAATGDPLMRRGLWLVSLACWITALVWSVARLPAGDR